MSTVVTNEITKVLETTDTQLLVTDSGVDTVVVGEYSNPVVSNEVLVQTAVIQDSPTVIVAAALQGPPGANGVPEDEMTYSKRVDFVDDNTLYRGEAAVGSAESAAAWRIRLITFAVGDGDVSEVWADGSADFDKVWVDRATYSYS